MSGRRPYRSSRGSSPGGPERGFGRGRYNNFNRGRWRSNNENFRRFNRGGGKRRANRKSAGSDRFPAADSGDDRRFFNENVNFGDEADENFQNFTSPGLSNTPIFANVDGDMLRQLIQPCLRVIDDEPFVVRPKGWRLYFPCDRYKPDDDRARLVDAFRKFYLSEMLNYDYFQIRETRRFFVDAQKVLKNADILAVSPNISELFSQQPEEVFQCAGLSMYQLIIEEIERIRNAEKDEDDSLCKAKLFELPRISARFVNVEPILSILQLQAVEYNRLVCVRGVIVKMTGVEAICTRMAYRCITCERTFTMVMPNDNYATPDRCVDPECRGRVFSVLRESPETETNHWQRIRLQDVADEGYKFGEMAKTVECELIDDLAGSCILGCVVTVVGSVKIRSDESSENGQCLIYLSANSVKSENQNSSVAYGSVSASGYDRWSDEDLQVIAEIRRRYDFASLVRSLCPSIFGHDVIKAGLLLACFGGGDDGDNLRNSIHILVMGDPGMGKTVLLQACSRISPRGVYVAASSASLAGLTVTVNSSSNSESESSLEAGALLIADGGCCCIDEFHKLPAPQRKVLLEVMEQQRVSLSKGGVIACLPARTSILAAANSVYGHYNSEFSLEANLRMDKALLSRFDLIFILSDQPDFEHDGRLADRIFAIRNSTNNYSQSSSEEVVVAGPSSSGEDSTTLRERLKVVRTKPLPPQLLRKYVDFARRKVRPKLSVTASEMLTRYFWQTEGSRSVFADHSYGVRRMQSLIRMAQARARCELRATVLESDVVDVLEIIQHAEKEAFAAYNNTDPSVSMAAKPLRSGRQTDQIRKFTTILTREVLNRQDDLFTEAELRQIYDRCNMSLRGGFTELLLKLNHAGMLLNKANRQYQFVCDE